MKNTGTMADCGTKGLLDYLILPLVARKIIGDFLLQAVQCSNKEHPRNYIDKSLWALLIPALIVEILRYAVGLALTLASAVIIIGIDLLTCKQRHQIINLNEKEQNISNRLCYYK